MTELNRNELGLERSPEQQMALDGALAKQMYSLLHKSNITNLRLDDSGRLCGTWSARSGWPSYQHLYGIRVEIVEDKDGKERIMINADEMSELKTYSAKLI